MGIKESALPQKSLVSTDDFLRVVGSDGSSYKQKVPSVSDSIMMGAAKTIPSGSVNDLTTPGMYYCYSAVTGLPTTGLYRVRVEYYGGAYNQYANPNGSNDIYFRTYSNGAWGSWVKMPTRAEVDALNSKTLKQEIFEFNVSGGWTAGKTIGTRVAQQTAQLSMPTGNIAGVTITYIGDSSAFHPLAFVANGALICNWYAASSGACTESGSRVQVRVSYT